MDMIKNKPCIISAGIGGWHPAGVERLHRSLVYHGYAGKLLLWKDTYPHRSPTHQQVPYAFKVYAFLEAFSRGFKVVMWLDSSFWCVKTPHNLFDTIVDKGVVAFRSGYNCAQTAPDNLLAYTGFTRDEAETLPEIATGMIGLNIDNPNAKALFDLWAKMAKDGMFNNDRAHNPLESADKRYLHGRQDQSAFSMAVHKLGLHVDCQNTVAYYGTPHNTETTVFFIGGL